MTEILSPVGSIEAMYAAINSGCDAIYLAGELYGARKATTKFDLNTIKTIIDTCHKYRVKVYITINTLIFDDEIDECIEYTDKIYEMSVDAILIQDMGLINIFSKRYPDLDLHISTQANIKTLEEVKFFQNEPNVKRIVLARETPISEIKRIKENTNIEIEVFVHGAICISYSGNCLFSSMAFNRSGNRGECAQPCRLKYSLYENDKLIDDNKYLLSPKELNTIEYAKELIKIGVDSFKIEGRIKSPEYVAVTTSLYKEIRDNPNRLISEDDIDKLKRAYNREFTKGYLFNIKPNTLVNNFRPNNQGVFLGTVLSNEERIKIKLTSTLNRLDGIRIISKEKDDYGLIVDKIYLNNKEVEVALKDDIVEIESYKMPRFNCKGLDVYVTSSISLKEEYKYILDKIDRHNIPLNIVIDIKKDEYPVIKELNNNVSIIGDFKVLEASNKPIDNNIVFNQLNKLQDTPYYIKNINYNIDTNSFVPIGVLNALRRDLINKIDEKYLSKYQGRKIITDIKFNKTLELDDSPIIIKVETMDQFIESFNLGFKTFYVYDYELYLNIKSNYDCDIRFMYPRIINDYSLYNIKNGLCNEVGNVKDNNIDSYLNVTNVYSLNYYLNRGARFINISYEVSRENVLKMVSIYKEKFNSIPNISFTIYDKVDLMIMKYCLISGHYKSDIGCNICRNNTYKIKDRNGQYNEIITTNDCQNRILNSKTLCLFEYKNELYNSGIKTLRINFTTENKEEVREVLNSYLSNKPLNGNKYTYGNFIK